MVPDYWFNLGGDYYTVYVQEQERNSSDYKIMQYALCSSEGRINQIGQYFIDLQ